MKRFVVLFSLLILAACQSSPSSPSTDPSDPTNPVTPTLTLTPASINVNAGDAPVTFIATVQNSSEAVTWVYSGTGSITPTTGPATSYTPPPSVTDVQSERLTAVLGTTGVSTPAVIAVYPADETPPSEPPPTDPTDASDPTDPTDPTDATDPTDPDPTTPDPSTPDPTNPDPTNPDPTVPNDDLGVSIIGANPRPAAPNTSTALQATVTNAGATATYAWTQVFGPPDGADFADPTAKDTNVTFSVADRYVLQLTVTSGSESASDTVEFDVAAVSENGAPEVNIDGEVGQEAVTGVPLNLSSVGTDPDGDALTYQWSVNFGDASKVTWSSTTTPNTSVTFSSGGNYSLRVTVTDPEGLTDEDDVSVEVETNPTN